MPVTFDHREGVLIAGISGDLDHHSLDHHSAAPIREAIDRMAESAMPKVLVLDFGGVGFMDSSGIGLIMGRYKLMDSMGGSVRVEHASPQLKKVIKLAGLSLLPIPIS